MSGVPTRAPLPNFANLDLATLKRYKKFYRLVREQRAAMRPAAATTCRKGRTSSCNQPSGTVLCVLRSSCGEGLVSLPTMHISLSRTRRPLPCCRTQNCEDDKPKLVAAVIRHFNTLVRCCCRAQEGFCAHPFAPAAWAHRLRIAVPSCAWPLRRCWTRPRCYHGSQTA